jgi:hypothetical protein
MLADIDNACAADGVFPDLFLSAHSHSYQCYIRSLHGRQIPYIVAGMGGINDQAVPAATGQHEGDHTFVKSRKGFGYMLLEATSGTITAQMIAVEGEKRHDFHKIDVTL